MRVLVYLIALLIVGTAVAQNPTIIQGSYITNVFGNSNFVLNPNARTDTTNVVPVNATVTRSTTTPLVATSEFLVTTSTSTGTISWPLRVFDQGMKGQNCEARFSYRGFSVGSTTAQIVQGSNVVAQLTLTPSTDPRIASINFPCGDLSSATTFRLQQATASLTGTNEIGGIYVGLATNMANVAQAELVGSVTLPGGTNCIPRTSSATFAFLTLATNCGTPTYTGNVANFSQDPFGFEVRNLKVGNYQIVISGSGFGMNGNGEGRFYLQDTTNSVSSMQKRIYTANAGETVYSTEVFNLEYTSQPTSTATFRFYGLKSPSGDAGFYGNATNFRISVYRFPSSSELVVTPERQNTWAAIRWSNPGSAFFSVVNNTWTSGNTTLFGDSIATTYGKAVLSGANTSQIRIPSMPVGYYRIKYNGSNYANSGGAATITECRSRIIETSTSTAVVQNAYFGATSVASDIMSPGLEGVFYNPSVADRTFRLDIAMNFPTTGITSQRCGFFSGTNENGATSAGAVGTPWMIVQPLDQPSNSALYVEGPVKASATGAAIPAGYQGETKFTQALVCNNITGNCGSGNYGALFLEPGIWDIEGCSMTTNSSGWAATNESFFICLTDVNGKDPGTCSHISSTESPQWIRPITSNNNQQLSQCTTLNGYTVTSAKSIYLTGFVGGGTGVSGTRSVFARMKAIRRN